MNYNVEYSQGTLYLHNEPERWVSLATIDSNAWEQGRIGAAEQDRILEFLAAAPRMYAALRQIVWKLNRNEASDEDADTNAPARISRYDIVIKQAQELLDELETRT